MFRHERQVRRLQILALVLAVIFVGAQFHYCADLSSANPSHICPLCSAAGSVVAPPALTLTIQPLTSDLEVVVLAQHTSVDVFRATSPRAPPASLPS